MTWRRMALGAVAAVVGLAALRANAAVEPLQLDLLGTASLAPDAAAGHDPHRPLGGLSAIVFDEHVGLWLAVCDDAVSPRIYALQVEWNGLAGTLAVRVEGVIELPIGRDAAHDAESIAPAPGGGWFVGYEQPPRICRFTGGFAPAGEVAVRGEITSRIRPNRAWESLALRRGAEGPELWAITEMGLAPPAAGQAASDADSDPTHCVALVIDPGTLRVRARGVYEADRGGVELPLAARFNSLADIAALPDGSFLALERSMTAPQRRFDAVLYHVQGRVEGDIATLTKRRLASASGLGVKDVRNLEGIGVGPSLTTGGLLVLMVSDDNFGADGLAGTQVVALRLRGVDERSR